MKRAKARPGILLALAAGLAVAVLAAACGSGGGAGKPPGGAAGPGAPQGGPPDGRPAPGAQEGVPPDRSREPGAAEQPGGPPYPPEQVAAWYNELRDVLALPGVTMSDYDEMKNEIVFFAGSVEARERVLKAVRERGVPEEVVRIETPRPLLSEREPLKGCEPFTPPEGEPQPEAPVALELSKQTVRPGEVITLTAVGPKADEVTRGIDAYLECWTGEGWEPRFTLLTEGWGQPPRALLYGTEGGIPGVGLMGPGPEPHQVPEQLTPGWYRIRKDLYPYEATAYIQVEE